ncbi:MAG: hypothetical protein QOF98_2446 [Streptomyces sp.]|jgi:hypothetical protein|nr:hypothetical protein [Streptomyces sp.]
MNEFDATSNTPADEAAGTTAVQERPASSRRMSKKKGGLILAAGLAVAGLATAGMSTASASASTVTPTDTVTPTAPPTGGTATPEPGGSTGIVDALTTTGFTFKTATGIEVTVTEASTTKYKDGVLPAKKSVVKTGESVLVLGTVSTSDITATEVDVQPHGDGGAAASEAAGVIAFQSGVPSPTQSEGTIPVYTEGDGTIVTGATADKATTAAQAVVPGGIVDRVVVLADGSYEVHNISINWPHHVFLNSNFKVIGWE